MQLVKRLRVREMCWDQPDACTFSLESVDLYREDKGTHRMSCTLAATFAIPLIPGLIGRDIEYIFAHRMLTGKRFPAPGPRLATESEVWLAYSEEISSLNPNSVLLCEVVRREVWGWYPNLGYVSQELLRHCVRHVLTVASGSDPEFPPACSLTIELTPEEYENCTKLLPGSVFDLTLRLVPQI